MITSHQKSLRITMITLSIIALLSFTTYYFLFRDIKTKNEHISTMEHLLSIQDKKREYLISMQRIIQNLDPDISRINNSIIANGEDVQFIENLESLAHDNGLSIDIDSLVFEDDQKLASSTITTFKIKAKTKGEWLGTYTFLAQIESLPFKIKVNKFTMKSEESSDPKLISNNWRTDFEIRLLKYK